MKPQTSKEYIQKYTKFFQDSLQNSIQLRKEKQWQAIVTLLQKDLQQFEKLPAIIKQRVDQFAKSTLIFFLAEAQYHLKQELHTMGLLTEETSDERINQIKAKTYFMLYKQSNNLKHLEQASLIAKQSYGEDHRITQQITFELNDKIKKHKFQHSQAIPDFESFKQGLEPHYFAPQYKKTPNSTRFKTMHLDELEKIATEQSTLDPSKRIKTKDSLFKSETKINLFISQTTSRHQKISNIFITDNSELKKSILPETYQPNLRYSEMLLQRPQSCRPIKRKIPSQTIKKDDSESNIKILKISQLRKSQMKITQQMGRASSRKEFKESISIKEFENKSIQVELSNPLSIKEDQSVQEFSIGTQESIQQSYYSYNSQFKQETPQIDMELLSILLNRHDTKIKKAAATKILRNLRYFLEMNKKKKRQFRKQHSIDVRPKQNFVQLIQDIGATHMEAEEKIQRIKQMIHLCQILDQDQPKQWIVFLQIHQFRQTHFSITNIQWKIFRRLSSKKTQSKGEIIKLFKEFPQYSQLIDIWSSGIEGSNAIFVLQIQISINSIKYQLRLHFKNIQQFAKDNEQMNHYSDMMLNLLKYYNQSHNLNIKLIPHTQLFIHSKISTLEYIKFYQISQLIMGIINQEFILIKKANGFKLRKTSNISDYLIIQKQYKKDLKDYKKHLSRLLYPVNISSVYQELKIKPGMRNSSKSLSEKKIISSPSDVRLAHPKSLFSGFRAQSINLSEESQTETSEYQKRILEQQKKVQELKKKRRITIQGNYFAQKSSNYVKQEKIIKSNPYSHFQILDLQIYKQGKQWILKSLSFKFILNSIGNFIITSNLCGQKKTTENIISFDDFINQHNLSKEQVLRALQNYNQFNLITKLSLQQINETPRVVPIKLQNEEDQYIIPEYKSKKRLERRSIILDPNQISMSHYYIFQYKVLNHQRVQFRIKISQQNTVLYIYKSQQPIYIVIKSEDVLIKLQRMFRLIVQRQRMPDFGEFKQLQKVLYHYIQKQHKQTGCHKVLGFQETLDQIFNYELNIQSTFDIHNIILKNLIANKQQSIKNVLRSFCQVQEFTLVSKIKNIYGMNLMLLTKFKTGDNILLQIYIYPFNNRFQQYKTYLNQNDLQRFGIIQLTLEQQAKFIQKHLILGNVNNHKHLQIAMEQQYIYVNSLNDNLLNPKQDKCMFQRQKRVLHLKYRKIVKIRNQYIIISVIINKLDNFITYQIYIPTLTKLFRVNMTYKDLIDISSTELDQIIPNSFLENYREQLDQLPNKYVKFQQHMLKESVDIDDDNQTSKLSISNPSSTAQFKRLTTSGKKTIFNKSSFPQRVSQDYQIFKERVSFQRRITKFDFHYDKKELDKLLKYCLFSESENNLQIYFLSCYFWDRLLDLSEILLSKQNKYIFQIVNFRGIIRQLAFTDRVQIFDEDYQLEVFLEQSQIEYGSMFEQFRSISSKESQSINIYYSYKQLSENISNKINLKFQFRQCIYNYSNQNQLKYSQALGVLKKSNQYISNQIAQQTQSIVFPNYEDKSIIAFRTNKKTITSKYIIDNKTKYLFIYQSKLMIQVLVTILLKANNFYFILENSKTQIMLQIKKSVAIVQDSIPHIKILLKLKNYNQLGNRLFQTYKNHLIVKVFEQQQQQQQFNN